MGRLWLSRDQTSNRGSGSGFLLWAALIAAGLLLGQGVLTQLVDTRSWAPRDLWQRPLIDVGASVSLLIGLSTLLALRGQLRVGLRPYLMYNNLFGIDEGRRLPTPGDKLAISVDIENVGLGPAVVHSVAYSVKLEGDHKPRTSLDYEQVVKALQEADLFLGRDYYLGRIGSGAGLGKDRVVRVGEFPSAFQEKVVSLEGIVYYTGLLGQRRWKRVEFIPRTARELRVVKEHQEDPAPSSPGSP